jgi:hypothetical protein
LAVFISSHRAHPAYWPLAKSFHREDLNARPSPPLHLKAEEIESFFVLSRWVYHTPIKYW